MTTHPFTISGAQNAVSARGDIEDALQALASNNSATDEPSTPYANMWWYETDTNLLKMRDDDNLTWINVAYVNQSTNKFEILDDTRVVTTGGADAGLLGDQSTATWQAGTGTTESLVSPAKVKAAIQALAFDLSAYDFVGADGYFKLKNGLIFQWGQKDPTSGTTSVSFNITFPNQVLFIGSQLLRSGQNYQSTAINPNYTTTGFTLYNDGQDFWWWALGR